ncbi:MAG: hypothetical protein DWQ06_16580 [Calditrichaeota bacterium]|nr:MAG: hypothetical protein DWQ06_16580 [Calditrichota bacterium]
MQDFLLKNLFWVLVGIGVLYWAYDSNLYYRMKEPFNPNGTPNKSFSYNPVTGELDSLPLGSTINPRTGLPAQTYSPKLYSSLVSCYPSWDKGVSYGVSRKLKVGESDIVYAPLGMELIFRISGDDTAELTYRSPQNNGKLGYRERVSIVAKTNEIKVMNTGFCEITLDIRYLIPKNYVRRD